MMSILNKFVMAIEVVFSLAFGYLQKRMRKKCFSLRNHKMNQQKYTTHLCT